MKKNNWMKKAEECFIDKKIVAIEWMSTDELDEMMWNKAPICLKLDDGTYIFPLRDDEGNDGGSLGTFNPFRNPPNYTFPIFSAGWDKNGE